MKVQIIYSSLSGCTKKVAESIFNGLTIENKSIHNLCDGEPNLDGDIIILGYWTDRAGPNKEMKDFMPKINGKVIGVFCTLAYYADSNHARESLINGINLVKDNNNIIGGYVCNGTISPAMIEKMRQNTNDHYHTATPQKEIRWDIMKNHPTSAECNLASERFNERIELYKRFKENNLEFTSIL